MKTAMSWYHLGLRGRLFMAFGVVAALVVAVSLFYYVRRWQLMHSDKVQHGFEKDED